MQEIMIIFYSIPAISIFIYIIKNFAEITAFITKHKDETLMQIIKIIVFICLLYLISRAIISEFITLYNIFTN